MKIKLFIVALILTVATVASAQTPWPPQTPWPQGKPLTGPALPRTVPWTDKNGQQIGTATFSGQTMVLRNLKGDVVASIVTDANGSTIYDPNGKITDHKPRR
jgi:hypothetical protein